MNRDIATFKVGDRVVSKRVDKRAKHWASGVVVMVVPAGVSPYAMWRRWLKGRGVCKMAGAKNFLMHRERYIVAVERNGRPHYYCPSSGAMSKE